MTHSRRIFLKDALSAAPAVRAALAVARSQFTVGT